MSKYKKGTDGRYHTRLKVGYDENGNAKIVYINAQRVGELEEKIREIKYRMSVGQCVVDSSVLLKDYAEIWFKADKATAAIATQEMYRNLIKNHLGTLAYVRLKDLTHNAIQIQINAKADRPNIQKKLAVMINAICESAVKNKLLGVNPCGELSLTEHEAKSKRVITAAEMDIIAHADLTLIERAFIDVLRGTGMRPAEVYALTWSDVDFKAKTIHVNKSLTFQGTEPVVKYPKTKCGTRDLQAPTWVFNSLKILKGTSIGLVIFAGENGRYMSKAAYKNMYNVLMRKCFGGGKYDRQWNKIDMYCFRHTYATNLVKSIPLIDIKEIQRLMGHSSPKVLMDIYAHVTAEASDTQAKLDAIL